MHFVNFLLTGVRVVAVTVVSAHATLEPPLDARMEANRAAKRFDPSTRSQLLQHTAYIGRQVLQLVKRLGICWQTTPAQRV